MSGRGDWIRLSESPAPEEEALPALCHGPEGDLTYFRNAAIPPPQPVAAMLRYGLDRHHSACRDPNPDDGQAPSSLEISTVTDYMSNAAPVRRSEREQQGGHRGCAVWFTGLSGSGKSTLAHSLARALFRRAVRAYVLDGDEMRAGLNADLGFSAADRQENVRRVGEVAKLFADAGVVTAVALISPYQHDRDRVRSLIGPHDFIEVFVDAPLDVCERRDCKGLYRKARAGEVSSFTGVSAPYEAPAHPDLVLRTNRSTPDECVAAVMTLLERRGILACASVRPSPGPSERAISHRTL